VKTGLVNEADLCGEKCGYCELGVEGLSLVKYATLATSVKYTPPGVRHPISHQGVSCST
jgi:hypothetical protein